MKPILFFSISLLAWQVKAQSCESVLQHETVAPIIQALSQQPPLSEVSVWPGFASASAPIIFSNDRDFPQCLVVWYNKKASAFAKPSNFLPPPNKLYTFCGSAPLPSCPDVSQAGTIETAVLYKLDNILESLNNQGFKAAQLNFMTLSHESFHYFGQAMQFKNGLWPMFPSEPGFSLQARDKIVNDCYKANEQLLSLTKKEFTALREAMNLALANETAESVKTKVREFFSLRSERYTLVSEVHIVDGQTDRSCEQAEALMELIEGAAEYVGLQSTMDAGLMTFSEMDRWIGLALDAPNGPSEPYYRSGAMALIILNKMEPTGLRNQIKEMPKATEAGMTVLSFLKSWAEK